MLSRIIVAVIFLGAAAWGAEEPEFTGVVRIYSDRAFLEADDGAQYLLRGTDVGNLQAYRGLRVHVYGTQVQPTGLDQSPIIYADRIVVSYCGNPGRPSCPVHQETDAEEAAEAIEYVAPPLVPPF